MRFSQMGPISGDFQAQLEARDMHGRSALHCAASRGSVAIAKMLLETGGWRDVQPQTTATPHAQRNSSPLNLVVADLGGFRCLAFPSWGCQLVYIEAARAACSSL